MRRLSVTPLCLEKGVWYAHVISETEPDIHVRYRDQLVDGVALAPADDGWRLTVPVPQSALSDGVHTFLVLDGVTAEKLADFSIAAGAPVSDDLRTEIELLRAELDLLKQAFRRSQRLPD